MASVLKMAITGLEHFHPQYGKLIGTGKTNGIQVYESILNGQRALTSVKDGEVVKQVVRRTSVGKGDLKDYNLTTTEVRDFVTNDRFKSVRGTCDVFDKEGELAYSKVYRNIEKQSENGNWEEFTTRYSTSPSQSAQSKAMERAHGYMRYGNYDVESGKFIEYESPYHRFTELRAGQRNPEMEAVSELGVSDGSIEAEQLRKAYEKSWYDLPGGRCMKIGKAPQKPAGAADYELPNGAKIPAGETHEGNWVDYARKAENRLAYYQRSSEQKMEQNLGNYIFNFLDKLVCKLNGVKLPLTQG